MLIEESEILNPLSADVHRELGVPYLKRGMGAEFEEHYQLAVKYHPVEWQGWRGYIYLYFYRDYENAIKDFNALDTLTPNFVDYPQATSVHFMRAISYLKLEQYDQALSFLDQHLTEELRTSTEDYIDSKTFLYQGIAHYKKGDLIQAKASFNRGTTNAPDNADLWFWTAKLAIANGDKNQAKSALEKSKIQLQKEYINKRNYVEEFFQIYPADIEELEEEIRFTFTKL